MRSSWVTRPPASIDSSLTSSFKLTLPLIVISFSESNSVILLSSSSRNFGSSLLPLGAFDCEMLDNLHGSSSSCFIPTSYFPVFESKANTFTFTTSPISKTTEGWDTLFQAISFTLSTPIDPPTSRSAPNGDMLVTMPLQESPTAKLSGKASMVDESSSSSSTPNIPSAIARCSSREISLTSCSSDSPSSIETASHELSRSAKICDSLWTFLVLVVTVSLISSLHAFTFSKLILPDESSRRG